MPVSQFCCLCGAERCSYNNPEPIRDDTQDCCDECNLLVRKARRKAWSLPVEEYAAYVQRLHSMSYTELVEELKDVQ